MTPTGNRNDILLSGYYGCGNLGDDLLLTVAVEELRAILPGTRFLLRDHGAALPNLGPLILLQAGVPLGGGVVGGGVVGGGVVGGGVVGGGVVGGVPPSSVRFFCWTVHWPWHRPQSAPTKLAPAVVSPLRRHLR